MIYYSRITAKNKKETVLELFYNQGAEDGSIILDSSFAHKQNGGTFQNLKVSLLENQEELVIDTLHSLGKTNREISKELQWFFENNIRLYILDIPSSFEDVVSPMQVLAECYARLAEIEIKNVKHSQQEGIRKAQSNNTPLGRKRIPYPPNWDILYEKWKHKEISISDFMAQTGLKRGTLYNLIKQQKVQDGQQNDTEAKEA